MSVFTNTITQLRIKANKQMMAVKEKDGRIMNGLLVKPLPYVHWQNIVTRHRLCWWPTLQKRSQSRVANLVEFYRKWNMLCASNSKLSELRVTIMLGVIWRPWPTLLFPLFGQTIKVLLKQSWKTVERECGLVLTPVFPVFTVSSRQSLKPIHANLIQTLLTLTNLAKLA